MCYFELYHRYKVYIPTMVLGVLLEIIGSLMIAVGASWDDKELYGWGIFIDLVGLGSFLYGLWVVCMLYNPDCTKSRKTDTSASKYNLGLYRQRPFPPFMIPSHPPTVDMPNALALQSNLGFGADPAYYQGAGQGHLQQPDYQASQSSYNSGADRYPTGQRPLIGGGGRGGPQSSIPSQSNFPPQQRPGSTASGFYAGSGMGPPGGGSYGPYGPGASAQPPPQPTGPRTAYQAQGGAGASYMI